MQVPFIDLGLQYAELKKPLEISMDRVFQSGQFIMGDEVEKFENEYAAYVGTRYCIAVNSGTDALVLGFRALALPEGSEVILPTHTFFATALGITENRLKPIFVDEDPNDFGMDLGDLKKKITDKTKAIVVVHLYGQPDKLDEIRDIIKKTGRDIVLIEDACQAHGATYKGKKTGSFGIFGAFSFYPGKNLGAYGDGGAIVTNSPNLAKKLRFLRMYGQSKKYHHDVMGTNSRLDTLQAAVLSIKLPHLHTWNQKRRDAAAYYTKNLRAAISNIVTPPIISGRESIFHLYVIRVPRRNRVLTAVKAHGVGALIHYPIPLHLQKAFRYLGYKNGDYPVAERIAKQIISLPIYPEITTNQMDYVIRQLARAYES